MTEGLEIENGVLTLPEGITRIEDEAFTGLDGLREVLLPEGLLKIGPAAFAECGELESVRLPCTLRAIGEGAFLNCASLRDITFPETLEEIGDMAFWGSGLEAVRVPESVRRVGESAFWSCAGLRRADVRGRGTYIGENAFGDCPVLQEGFIAPGYGETGVCAEDGDLIRGHAATASAPSELLYTLLWCSCPDLHGDETCRRAEAFVREHEELIMEHVFKGKNIAALTGLVRRRLLRPENIGRYVEKAAELGSAEFTALLLEARGSVRAEEFEL